MKKYQKTLAVIGTSVTAGFAAMHLTNILFEKSACKNELITSNDGFYYTSRFGKIFFTKQGVGKPVLLIHELNPSCSHMEFKALADKLSADHTVYNIDLLGCGRSDKPVVTYTSYMYVQLIHDFVKNVIGKKTHLIASGESSSIALLTCNIDADLFGKLILVNPPSLISHYPAPGFLRKLYKNMIEMPVLGTFLYNLRFNKSHIGKVLEKDILYKPAPDQEASSALSHKRKLTNWLYEGSHLNGYGSKYLYSSMKSGYLNVNIVPALKNTNNSIYMIMGQSEKHRAETVKNYKACNASIRSVVLSQSKHVPHLENPARFFDLCKLFLSGKYF